MPILDWLDKEQAVRKAKTVPYRLLKPVKKLSYGDPESENMLIQGDNLDALKALLPLYAGKVKCIYIDPPYNTENAFEHYDDNLEHATWLSTMYPRLELLRDLLSSDGYFCCHIDDSEGPYLKAMLDEVFGRNEYVVTLFIQVRYIDKTLKSDMDFHKQIEQIYVYRSSFSSKPNRQIVEAGFDKFRYKVKELGKGKEIELGNKKVVVFEKEKYEIIPGEPDKSKLKEIWASGSILDGNSSGRFFRDYLTGRYESDGYGTLYKVYGIGNDQYDYRYFTGPKRVGATKGKYYQGVPVDKLKDDKNFRSVPIENFYDLASSFGNCRSEGGVAFRSGKKPEALLKIILDAFSKEGDIVLDSFLGSGTTAAVAHKMKRKFIGIEMGKQAETHCKVRLENVINGDQGGISQNVNWQGGGGFHFYQLGSPIFDEFGVIRPDIRFAELAAHIWYMETRTPLIKKPKTALLGTHHGKAYYLLYNGILGDRKPQGGNVLTSKILATLPAFDGEKIIYGEATRLGEARLKAENITFKQMPYDVGTH